MTIPFLASTLELPKERRPFLYMTLRLERFMSQGMFTSLNIRKKFRNESLLRLSLLTPQPMWLSLQKMRCQLMLIMLRIMGMMKEMTHQYLIQNLNPPDLVDQVECITHLCQMMTPNTRDQPIIMNLRVLIQWASVTAGNWLCHMSHQSRLRDTF